MQSDEYKLWISKAEDNLLWASDNLEDGFYIKMKLFQQKHIIW